MYYLLNGNKIEGSCNFPITSDYYTDIQWPAGITWKNLNILYNSDVNDWNFLAIDNRNIVLLVDTSLWIIDNGTNIQAHTFSHDVRYTFQHNLEYYVCYFDGADTIVDKASVSSDLSDPASRTNALTLTGQDVYITDFDGTNYLMFDPANGLAIDQVDASGTPFSTTTASLPDISKGLAHYTDSGIYIQTNSTDIKDVNPLGSPWPNDSVVATLTWQNIVRLANEIYEFDGVNFTLVHTL